MKLITPDYYKDFACIADKCRHNCCIGWEIDIDRDTYEFYENVPGEFGERLRSGITCGDTPCFKLGDGERCVFLNDRGLCDIILNLGEDALCDICTDHPRFRNFFSDRTEIGLGLCCEEACRLILSQSEPMRFVVTEDDGEDDPDTDDAAFFEERDLTFGILQDRTISLSERFAKLSEMYDAVECDASAAEWAEFYRSLERLDPLWDKYLDILSGCSCFVEPSLDTVWENLAVYLIYRHSANYPMPDAVLLCIHTVKLVCTLSSAVNADFEKICDICRMWSSEIEYSEENTEKVMNRITE